MFYSSISNCKEWSLLVEEYIPGFGIGAKTKTTINKMTQRKTTIIKTTTKKMTMTKTKTANLTTTKKKTTQKSVKTFEFLYQCYHPHTPRGRVVSRMRDEIKERKHFILDQDASSKITSIFHFSANMKAINYKNISTRFTYLP